MSRFAIYLFVLGILLCPVNARAQTDADKSKQTTYETMLARLRSGDTKIDFGALRKAYTETAAASPYGTPHEIRRQMNAAVMQQRCDEAMKIADEILAGNYLSPDTHIVKSICYRSGGDNAKADLHKAVYLGLINSILASGDGLKPESAYVVISIEEEYAVMRALGFTVWKQEQLRKGEHAFEVLSGTNDRAGLSTAVYFNIDIPAALERRKSQK
jgi:hypothetical protein